MQTVILARIASSTRVDPETTSREALSPPGDHLRNALENALTNADKACPCSSHHMHKDEASGADLVQDGDHPLTPFPLNESPCAAPQSALRHGITSSSAKPDARPTFPSARRLSQRPSSKSFDLAEPPVFSSQRTLLLENLPSRAPAPARFPYNLRCPE